MLDVLNIKAVVLRHRIVVIIVLVLGFVAAALVSHRTKTYTAQSSVILVSAPNAQGTEQSDTTRLPVQVADLPALLSSADVVKAVAADMHATGDEARLRSSVRARPSTDSSIMPISYTSRNAEESISGANAFATELTVYYRKISTSRFDRLIDDLQRQVHARSVELANVEQRLNAASIIDPYLDAKTGSTSVNAESITFRDKRDALDAATKGDVASAAVLAGLLQDVRPLATQEMSESDPAYQKLASQSASDQAALAHARAMYSPDYPGLPELTAVAQYDKEQLERLRRNITAGSPVTSRSYEKVLEEKLAADARVKSDQAELVVMDNKFANFKSQMQAANGQNLEVAHLHLQHDTAEAAYTLLAGRLTTALADRSQAASIGSISVIDRATSASASSSTGNIVGAVACIVIFSWIAIALAFYLDAAASRMTSTKRIEEFYGAPAFNVVGA